MLRPLLDWSKEHWAGSTHSLVVTEAFKLVWLGHALANNTHSCYSRGQSAGGQSWLFMDAQRFVRLAGDC